MLYFCGASHTEHTGCAPTCHRAALTFPTLLDGGSEKQQPSIRNVMKENTSRCFVAKLVVDSYFRLLRVFARFINQFIETSDHTELP